MLQHLAVPLSAPTTPSSFTFSLRTLCPRSACAQYSPAVEVEMVTLGDK